jgi:DNA polymerase
MSTSSSAPESTEAGARREALKAVFARASACTRCPELAAARHTVVFGAGNADADLMFIGEAPGATEDQQGLPFVGQAGKLLEKLLGEIGLARVDVFIANVLKCRPPGNRDPLPVEIENCQEYLFEQVGLIQPRVICSLGNFSTKLLRRDPAGITRVHGRPEVITLGRRAVRLYPIFHPAAALYTPRMLETLREDFARLPELLAQPAPDQPPAEDAEIDAALAELTASERSPEAPGASERFAREPAEALEASAPDPVEDQLGLF